MILLPAPMHTNRRRSTRTLTDARTHAHARHARPPGHPWLSSSSRGGPLDRLLVSAQARAGYDTDKRQRRVGRRLAPVVGVVLVREEELWRAAGSEAKGAAVRAEFHIRRPAQEHGCILIWQRRVGR